MQSDPLPGTAAMARAFQQLAEMNGKGLVHIQERTAGAAKGAGS